ACYTHMSAWPAVGLLWLALFATVVWTMHTVDWAPRLRPLLIAAGVSAAALAPWALMFLYGHFSEDYDPVWKLNRNPEYFAPLLAWMPQVMTWGGGPRAMLTLLFLAIGTIMGLVYRKTRYPTLALLAISLGTLGAISFMLKNGLFAIKYYNPLWTSFITLSALGFGLTADGLKRIVRSSWVAHGLLAAGLAGAMVAPIKALLTLPGNPKPYTHISSWLDRHLLPGAPVVIDGMGIARHEIRPHAPTNVYVTFTVPDLGFQMWRQNRWRDSVRLFCTKYADAAFVETGRAYYDEPGVGPFDWPRTYFAHSVTLTNQPGMALRRMKLAPLEEFYNEYTNGLVTKIFYNEPDDVLAFARQNGRRGVILYGAGWKYLKSADYRDWRTFDDEAEIIVHNLTSNVQTGRLAIVGQALNTPKRVAQGDVDVVFQPNQLQQLNFDVTLSPGPNRFRLSDPDPATNRTSLLVAALVADVEKVDGEQPAPSE
ncbi:MAG: hypothetical protein AAF492_03830, partial [Verrucomicrobiota bacterium]